MFDCLFPACTYFFKVQISSCTLIPLFTPGCSMVVQRAEDDCHRVFHDELRVSSFLDRFPHYAWTAAQSTHSNFNGSRVYACLGVTCYLHFWLNNQGLLRATAVTRWWNRHHRTGVSKESWLWRRTFSCCSCWDSNLQPFDHESLQHFNQQAIYHCYYSPSYHVMFVQCEGLLQVGSDNNKKSTSVHYIKKPQRKRTCS